jgi:hypothetical protein
MRNLILNKRSPNFWSWLIRVTKPPRVKNPTLRELRVGLEENNLHPPVEGRECRGFVEAN